MVKTTGVRGPTLARLATVSVLCFKLAVNRVSAGGIRRAIQTEEQCFLNTYVFEISQNLKIQIRIFKTFQNLKFSKM